MNTAAGRKLLVSLVVVLLLMASIGSASAEGFGTIGTPPGAFNKTAPADALTGVPVDPTLSWEASAGATGYKYCVYTAPATACGGWNDTGTLTSVALSGLNPNTTYYWHVIATNVDGETNSNGTPTFWSFTIEQYPGDFHKSAPLDGATGVSLSPILSWEASAHSDLIRFCYDDFDDDLCINWQTLTENSIQLSGLNEYTTYYWQVYNYSYLTFLGVWGDGSEGAYFSFTTGGAPGAFGKSSPANGARNRPASLTLSWAESSTAVEYEYCLKTSGICTWISTGSATSAAVGALSPGTYRWSVRAKNGFGTTIADGAVFWTFTVPPAPGAFSKTSPVTNAVNRLTNLTFYWAVSPNAASYQFCIKPKMSDTCTWKSTGTNRYIKITGLDEGIKYFWQVRAKNAVGITTANVGTWWNFTTAD